MFLACCRQYENGECNRGGFCNFMHLKPVSKQLKKELYQGQRLSIKMLKPRGEEQSTRVRKTYRTGYAGGRYEDEYVFCMEESNLIFFIVMRLLVISTEEGEETVGATEETIEEITIAGMIDDAMTEETIEEMTEGIITAEMIEVVAIDEIVMIRTVDDNEWRSIEAKVVQTKT